jgi:hypothetical protein
LGIFWFFDKKLLLLNKKNMSDLRYIVEDKGFTEEEMINNVSRVVEDINYSAQKMKKNLLHFRLQVFIATISYFLSLPLFVIISFLVISFIFFLRSGHFYSRRKDGISDYWTIIMKYKERGILNKDNVHKIEKFEIEEMLGDK